MSESEIQTKQGGTAEIITRPLHQEMMQGAGFLYTEKQFNSVEKNNGSWKENNTWNGFM